MRLKDGPMANFDNRLNRYVKRNDLPSYQNESLIQRVHGYEHQRLLELKSQKTLMDETMKKSRLETRQRGHRPDYGDGGHSDQVSPAGLAKGVKHLNLKNTFYFQQHTGSALKFYNTSYDGAQGTAPIGLDSPSPLERFEEPMASGSFALKQRLNPSWRPGKNW